MFEPVIQDVRYALRGLRRTPVFAAVAIITLALGIGINTTVFSIVEGLLLRPLPIVDADNVAFIQADNRDSNSFPDYRDLRDRNQTFSALAAYRISPMAIDTGGGADRIWGYLATGNYFSLLGIKPAVGRFFDEREDAAPGASPFAVLSYDAWQRRFAGSPDVVGTTVRVNGLRYTILGVAPRNFHGTEVFFRPDIWVPMSMQPQIEGRSWLENRGTSNCWLIGRIREDVTFAQATTDLNGIGRQLARDYPQSDADIQFSLV